MKHLASVVLALLLVAGLAFVPAALAQGKTHQGKAEFVSADADAQTVTVKSADGKTMVLKIEGKALEAVKGLQAGDLITFDCRDDEQGLHQAVVSIEKAKPAEKKKG